MRLLRVLIRLVCICALVAVGQSQHICEGCASFTGNSEQIGTGGCSADITVQWAAAPGLCENIPMCPGSCSTILQFAYFSTCGGSGIAEVYLPDQQQPVVYKKNWSDGGVDQPLVSVGHKLACGGQIDVIITLMDDSQALLAHRTAYVRCNSCDYQH